MEIVPVTPKVGVGPSTIVGYVLSALGIMTGVVADLSDNSGVLGIDNKWLVLAGVGIAVATNMFRSIQAAFAKPVPVVVTPAEPVVVTAPPTIPQV